MAFGRKTGGGSRKGRPNKISREIRELADAYVPLALGTIVGLARRAESETTRLEAAKEILNRRFGKPVRPDTRGMQLNVSQVNNYGPTGSMALPEGLDASTAYHYFRTGRIDGETAAGLLAIESREAAR